MRKKSNYDDLDHRRSVSQGGSIEKEEEEEEEPTPFVHPQDDKDETIGRASGATPDGTPRKSTLRPLPPPGSIVHVGSTSNAFVPAKPGTGSVESSKRLLSPLTDIHRSRSLVSVNNSCRPNTVCSLQ